MAQRLTPGVLYQYFSGRPFNLTGYPSVYIGIGEDGDYFWQDMAGRRGHLPASIAECVRSISIPWIPPDQRLPEGF